jgi:protocatechuate 3,4-dioxygenase beta subunit
MSWQTKRGEFIVDRRKLIKGMAALVPVLGANRLLAAETNGAAVVAGTCRLISQDIAGPYGIEDVPMRANIIDGQAGTPLVLNLRVIDSLSCQPLAGAVVSIWHANASGLYSGVQNLMLTADGQSTGEKVDLSGQTFLRGLQKTNRDGQVTFSTIYPGWYFPRPTHLHVTVFPPNYGELATTQLYFPDKVCDQAYEAAQYAERGPNPIRTDPSVDSPTDNSDAGDLWLDLHRQNEGFVASHNIGVTFYGDTFGELSGLYRQS